MTVVITDDLTSYANLAAMLAAGWTGYANGAVITGGAAGCEIAVPSSVGMWQGHQIWRTYSGLTAGAFYTVSAHVSTCTLDPPPWPGYDVGLIGFGAAGQQDAMLTHADATNVTLTTDPVKANPDGTLQVKLGFFYGSVGTGHDDFTVTFTEVTIDDGTPPPVFTTALPVRGIAWDQIAYTAGVMSISGVTVGLTRGALRFDPGETWEPYPFDGDFVVPVGAHELTGQRPRFLGSFLPVGPRQLALYLPKSTQVTSVDTTVVTPAVPGAALVTGDYSLNLSVTWPYLSGGTITVTFPYAFWQRYEFNPENKGEMLIPCEILGVPLSASAAPYYVTVVEPGTIS